MHYYQFNIGDYASHTNHLDPLEDIAYRRMMDWCYLHEMPLPSDIKEIARLIRMREECERIENVLRDFFYFCEDSYRHKRVDQEISKYHDKSIKAKASANARWLKTKEKQNDKNAMRTHSEGNANHKPLTNNQEPNKDLLPENLKVSMPQDFKLNKTNQSWLNDSNLTEFEKAEAVKDFVDYWILDESKKTAKGWQMAFRKNPIVKRKIVSSKHRGQNNGNQQQESKAKRHFDKLTEIARNAG